MKKNIISTLSILILFPLISLNAQWARTYGEGEHESLAAMKLTSDGGCVAVGWTNSFGVPVEDIWIIKVNPFGIIEWQRTYGGSDWDDVRDIQQTRDGGYIVAGKTQSFGLGNQDYWILKLNSSGQIEWQHTYGGALWDSAVSIIQTSDGGYTVGGYTYSFGAGIADTWILKLNASGQIEWQRTYGGIKSDIINCLQQTSDGGYIITGTSYTFGPGPKAIWILKITATGNLMWQRTYGGSSKDTARSIQQTTDGGYIVAAETGSFGVGLSEYLILKLDPSGDVEWQRTYGGPLWESPFSIQQTTDGGYIVGGVTYSFGAGESDCWILKLDLAGNIQWERVVGGVSFDAVRSVEQTVDGGYVVGALTESFGGGKSDFLMFKLSSEGNIENLACAERGFIIRSSMAFDTIPSVSWLSIQVLSADTSITSRSAGASAQETNVNSNLLCALKKKGKSIR